MAQTQHVRQCVTKTGTGFVVPGSFPPRYIGTTAVYVETCKAGREGEEGESLKLRYASSDDI